MSSGGGLSRFFAYLTSNFPKPYDIISPDSLINVLHIPDKNIDVIHCCDATLLPFGIFLKVLLKKSLTVTAHGRDLTYGNVLYQFMLRLLLPRADAVIIDSRAAKNLLSPFKISPGRIFLIHPGISIDHFRLIEDMELPTLKGKIVLLTVGNLVPRKGQVWFIDNVFSKLPDTFAYVIVGDGPQKDRIQRALEKDTRIRKRVFLLGRVTDPLLAFLYKTSDVYVCPNQTEKHNFEGFGIAVGEAAAMGLPVVASDVDGIPDIIVHQKNGLLVKPLASAFRDVILKLSNPLLRKKLGERASRYTRGHFSWNKTVEKYRSVYRNLPCS